MCRATCKNTSLWKSKQTAKSLFAEDIERVYQDGHMSVVILNNQFYPNYSKLSSFKGVYKTETEISFPPSMCNHLRNIMHVEKKNNAINPTRSSPRVVAQCRFKLSSRD